MDHMSGWQQGRAGEYTSCPRSRRGMENNLHLGSRGPRLPSILNQILN